MSLIRWGCMVGLCVLLAACSSFGTENQPATMQSDLTAYAAQATEIRVTGQARSTAASATIVAAQTQAAYYGVYNQVLVATVRAGETPVPAQILASGELEGSLGVVPTMEFLQVTMSDRINDSDRCALNDMALFDVAQTPKVYLTAVVNNLAVDTTLEVVWEYDSEQVHSTSWTATQSSTSECIAIELTPDQVAFVAGDWEATLLADGRVIQSVPFAMIDSAS
jgi:hypothetical protein